MSYTSMLFPVRVPETNPVVIVPTGTKSLYDSEEREVKGEFYRVIPATAHEVAFIASLPPAARRAPGRGHGIMIPKATRDQLK